MATRKTRKPAPTALFAIYGPEKGARFAFNAVDEADAQSKFSGWLRYHSMTRSDGFEVRALEVAPEWLPVRNEWVR